MRRPEFIARQSSRPRGLVGRLLGHVMAIETASLNSEALGLLALQAPDHLLEVGFGHGRTIRLAAAQVPHGFVAGVDVSGEMVRMAQRRCLDLTGKGLVELIVGDSRRLPYADTSFDKVLCVHTIYFWEKPIKDLSEIFRVLRPGGRLVLGFHAKSDKGSTTDFPETVYSFYSTDEVSTRWSRRGSRKARFGALALRQGRCSSLWRDGRSEVRSGTDHSAATQWPRGTQLIADCSIGRPAALHSG
jgi:ubiquinone/menaquinone biosynthesis C-methylase UbiE